MIKSIIFIIIHDVAEHVTRIADIAVSVLKVVKCADTFIHNILHYIHSVPTVDFDEYIFQIEIVDLILPHRSDFIHKSVPTPFFWTKQMGSNVGYAINVLLMQMIVHHSHVT